MSLRDFTQAAGCNRLIKKIRLGIATCDSGSMEISVFSLLLVLSTLSIFAFMGFATYRGLIALEHKHLMVTAAGPGPAATEVHAIQAKLSTLGKVAMFWGVVSGGLLAAIAVMWLS